LENEEEKGFEVVDNRGKRKEPAPPSGEAATEQPAGQQAEAGGDAQAGAAGEEEEAVGDVYSLIQWVILMLSESAWQWMGLHMNPATKKVEQDLAQAKVAIDSVVFLSDQIAPHVSEEQRRANRTLVSDLRVNFVQKGQA